MAKPAQKINRKKSSFNKTVLISLLLASMVVAGYIWYNRPSFVRYPQFGIQIPTGYSIHGIDVSRYQRTIGWDEVKAMRVKDVKMTFAFIKATEGIGNMDPQFKRNWKEAKENNMVRGAYHFFISSKDGKMQAENFIKRVNLQAGDIPPVLDVEQLNGVSGATVKKEVKRWLDVVENYYNVKPILYTNVDFYKNYLGAEFDSYPLWIAHYYEEHQPRIERGWYFWQHNDGGNVNGIDAKVDFNVFNGDSLEFVEFLYK